MTLLNGYINYSIKAMFQAEAPSSRVIFPLAFTEGSELPSGGWISTTWGAPGGRAWERLGQNAGEMLGENAGGKWLGRFFLIDQD